MVDAYRWPWAKLGKLLTFHGSGATPRGGKNSYKASGVPLVRSMNVHDLRFEQSALAFIDEAQACMLDRVRIMENDILLNITGASVARCCLAGSSAVGGRVNQHVMILRTDPSVADARWLARALAGPYKSRLLAIAGSGATREALTRSDVENFVVSLPSIDYQRQVANLLDVHDRLLEDNRRRIEILEEMARLLYREWFVHFRYPGHEDVELVDSDLGPIPEGWDVTTLGSVAASLVDGDWIETRDQGGSAYRLLQVSNVGLGSFRETGNFRYVTNETFERLNCTSIVEGDILISRMPDPVGRAWYVYYLKQPSITAVDVAILRPEQEADGPFLELYLNSGPTLAYSEQVATGTTRKRVTRTVLSRFIIPLPPHPIRDSFFQIVAPTYKLKSVLTRQNEALDEARDLLLPRLVSGTLDVSELELDRVPV